MVTKYLEQLAAKSKIALLNLAEGRSLQLKTTNAAPRKLVMMPK